YWLKNTGKNPAITVVANAELPQSYSAQLTAGRRCTHFTPCLLRDAARARRHDASSVALAGLVEGEIRPALQRQCQVHAGGRQVYQRAGMIDGEVLVGLGAELRELL